MTNMRMGWTMAFAGSALALAATGCGGLGTVRYEGDEVKRAGLTSADVAVYVVDCAEGQSLTCSYQGQPLPWRVVGWFHVPSKAFGKWDLYHDKVRDRAAQVGCRAVGLRRVPPPRGGPEEPVGALCLEVAPPAGPPVAPAVFSKPPEGAPPQRCNRDDDCTRGQSCQHNVCR
jgi:hypothetical protein